MNNKKEFERVYRTAEGVYGRSVTQLDIDRAYLRYLKVTGLSAA
jgi:hypothetical protein